MIYLVTGAIGACKTSNTLWDFLHNKAYKGRPKFATFINGFDYARFGVTKLEHIDKWHELPPGALVLVDEADKYIPADGSKGANMPEWLRELARSRHAGIDFFFITQMHSMIHHHVRGLVNAHVHYQKAFGGKRFTTRYRWERLETNVNSQSARNAAVKARVVTPAEVFTYYTSTVQDTTTLQLPWPWIITAGVCIAVIIGAMLYMYFKYRSPHPEPVSQQVQQLTLPMGQSSSSPSVMAGLSLLQSSSKQPERRPFTAEDFTPRIQLDPSTAPIYDHLTAPSDFPRIAACVDSRRGCHCYTQQATPVSVPGDICSRMVKEGWFDRWKSSRMTSMPAQPVAPGQPFTVPQGEAVSRTTVVAERPQTWPDT